VTGKFIDDPVQKAKNDSERLSMLGPAAPAAIGQPPAGPPASSPGSLRPTRAAATQGAVTRRRGRRFLGIFQEIGGDRRRGFVRTVAAGGHDSADERPVADHREHKHPGDMRLRWCTAGLLRAEESFRRVKGHKQMHFLVEALDRIVPPNDE
jgi:hypothetical protein